MMLYELNRVPDRTYIHFLKLLGQELKPALPARAYVTFTVQEGARQVDPVPQRTQLLGTPPDGGDPLIFETIQGLDLIVPRLRHMRVFGGAGFVPASRPFPPFGWVPQIDNALYLGFDFPEGSTPPPGRPFPRQMRMRAVLSNRGQAPTPVSCTELVRLPKPLARLVWEYNASTTATPRWVTLTTIEDTSVAFTRDGDLLIEGPPETIPRSLAAGIAQRHYWLRCRFASGTYQAGPPEIDRLLLNTVTAENLSTVADEIVSISEGLPDQALTLGHRPVQADTLVLMIPDPDGVPRPWEQRPDFLDSGPNDRHYVLNATTGEITFGDGTRGGIPTAGSEIVAETYRYGGGGAGNLPAGTITTLLTSATGVEGVTNELPAVGGRDEESIDDAKREAPKQLRSRSRAVTAEDFALHARDAGGVAKTTAIALAHPDFPGVEVPGSVQVVIVPDSPFLIADRSPLPSPDLLREVCDYLEEFRLITTEVFVTAPKYHAIRVEATVLTNRYAAAGEVERNVAGAIDEYLDPLGRKVFLGEAEPARPPAVPRDSATPAAKEEPGRRFGRDLYRSAIARVILGVKDVVAVSGLTVFVDDAAPPDQDEPIPVGPDELVYGTGDHRLDVKPEEDF
jgi:hypothetical protein